MVNIDQRKANGCTGLDDDNYELITKPTISGYGILHTFRKNNPAKREFYLIKCNTITNAPISLISLKLNDNV